MMQPVDTTTIINTDKTGANKYDYKYFNDVNSNSGENEIIFLENPNFDTSLVTTRNLKQRFLHNTHNIGLDWILFLLLAIMFVFAWLKNTSAKYLNQIVNSIINYQIASKLYRDTTVFFQKISTIFNLIYVVVFSLFLFELITYSNIVINVFDPIFLYPIILLSVSSLLFLRLIVFRVLGYIFDQHKQYEEGVFNILLYNKGIGIILFPIVAIMPYLPILFLLPLKILGIGVIILMNVLKMIREIKIILSKDFLIFYLILYFCALEILPLLLMYKFIHSYIH